MMNVHPAIVSEIRLLFLSFLLGIILMVVYDLIRFTRVLIRHKAAIVFVEDIFFWVVASGAIFALLFLENGGRIRFYAMAAVGLGMLLWYVLVGRRFIRFLGGRIKRLKQCIKVRRKNIDKSEAKS